MCDGNVDDDDDGGMVAAVGDMAPRNSWSRARALSYQRSTDTHSERERDMSKQ